MGKQLRLVSLLLLGVVVPLVVSFSHKSIYPKPHLRLGKPPHRNDVGDPLILTPFLKAGKIKEAQDAALVRDLTSVVSYSGFFTVNEKYDSNMFFWFFPAAFNPEKAPVMIWLQGGPGGSSLFGLFTENGPFIIDQANQVSFRNTAWTLTHSVIYIDNPVGTGFSFTKSDDGFARNEDDVARDLYSCMEQFFIMFPQFAKQDFYVTGESYAGKYVPAIAHKIHQENQKQPQVKINLKGVAIGDGFSDPESMLNYGEYLYNVGLLDRNEKAHFDQEEEKARQFIKDGKFMDAFLTIDNLLDGDLSGYPSYFKNVTGLDFYFNFLMSASPPDQNYYSSFLQLDATRKSIHVGGLAYSDLGGKVEEYLRNDMYQSVKPWIEVLLDAPEGYKVLMYSGQLDIIVASTLTDNFISTLKWNGADGFSKTERQIWRVGNDIAGYAKTHKNFSQVIVRNAGHMVPYDQPKWSFDLISRFTSGKLYSSSSAVLTNDVRGRF